MIETPLWLLIVGGGLALAGYFAIGIFLLVTTLTMRDRRSLHTPSPLQCDLVLTWPLTFPIFWVITVLQIRKLTKNARE